MRKPGKISPRQAAKRLDVHLNTVYAWCRKAEQGKPSKLSGVEKNRANGYYSISQHDIDRIRGAK